MGPEKHRGWGYSVPELILLGQHVPADALEEAETHFDNNSVVMMQYTPAPRASRRASCSRTATSSTTAST